MSDPFDHLGSIWYHSGPLDWSPITKNSNWLGSTFFGHKVQQSDSMYIYIAIFYIAFLILHKLTFKLPSIPSHEKIMFRLT